MYCDDEPRPWSGPAGVKTYDVRNSFPAVNRPLHDAVLVDAGCSQHVEGVLVARIDTIKDQATHNLLPSGTTLVPELRFLQVDDISNILHDTVQGPRCEHFVFIVIGDGDQQFRVSVVHSWAEVVAVPQCEFVRVTGGRRVCFAIRETLLRGSAATHNASV